MTSLVHDILKASLESQLKIEQSAYENLTATYKLENRSLVIMTDSKIKEIKRQLAVLDKEENK